MAEKKAKVKKSAKERLADLLEEMKGEDPELAGEIQALTEDQKTDAEMDLAATHERERQRSEKHYWIEIQRLPDDNEDRCFVGAAGVSYDIAKGEKVPVPKSVIDVLQNAEVDGHVPIVDETTGRKYLKRVKYKRYPFTLWGEAVPEEVTAWRRKIAEDAAARERYARGVVEEDNPGNVGIGI